MDLYKSVLERLLVALADEDDDDEYVVPMTETQGNTLAVHEERLKVWPPWPWPPWDPQDPGDPDHPGPGDPPGSPHKPINRTKEAPRLAAKIIEFEKKLANASLDLYV